MAILTANNQSLTEITSLPSGVSGGALVLLATETASSSSTISFASDIDDTYDEYVFKLYDINPSADGAIFQVNFRDGSSAYDATKTTTWFRALHSEDGSTHASLSYDAAYDVAQGTGIQKLTGSLGNGADESLAGTLQLFAPSNTTFVKHFLYRGSMYFNADGAMDVYAAGYCNVTAAIDGVQFSVDTGNFDGVIKMYGVS